MWKIQEEMKHALSFSTLVLIFKICGFWSNPKFKCDINLQLIKYKKLSPYCH